MSLIEGSGYLVLPSRVTGNLLDPYGRPLNLPVRRSDGWQNFVTGIGTGRDKTVAGHFWETPLLSWQELLSLFNGSALAAKIVEKRPKEMFRRGYTLACDDVNGEKVADLQKQSTKFQIDNRCRQGAIWGNLFGGALVIMNIQDGQTPDMPLAEDRIRAVKSVTMIDRRFAWAQKYYNNPFEPNYGMPETYLITNAVSGTDAQVANAVVHESRCLRFDGQETDQLTRQRLAGWTLPVLQRVYDGLRRFEHGLDSVNHLLSDASQAVFKLQGLIDAIANGQKDLVQARMALTDEMRSTARAILLDAEGEEFNRIATSFTGIPDVLDRWMLFLAAIADMPVTELFGRSPAGMNATGESDTRKWYDTIETDRKDQIDPKLKRWYDLLGRANGIKDVEWEINWAPLWSPTDAEQADVDLKRAQKDQIYVTIEAVSPEEVALCIQDQYPHMDVESREAALASAKKFDPYENDPTHSSEAAAEQNAQGEPRSPAAPPAPDDLGGVGGGAGV